MGDTNPRELFPYVAGELGRKNVKFLFIRELEGADSLLPFIKQSFGVPVIANPDLTERIAIGAKLNTPNPDAFYPPVEGPERDPAIGYAEYPAMVRVS